MVTNIDHSLCLPLYCQVPSTSTNQHDEDAAELMHSLRNVEYIGGGYTFLWLDTDQECFKHHLSDSWYNPSEALIAARVTDAIAEVTGDSQIMLITGYSKQVRPFCYLMKLFNRDTHYPYIFRFQ